ncbi:MAG: hypothetical protein KF836_04730 [Fimbriimonadaceae bacterium]|nr:hypothetical protein [Fimbriimonadaceae bacterium]
MLQSPPDPATTTGSAKDVHHRAPKKSMGEAVRDMFSIRYHVRRFREDMIATKAALEKRKSLLNGEATHEELPEIFRGKLMGVFFATGWTNLLGIFLGGVLQYRFGSQWLGLYATPFLCFIVTAIAFQIAWWLDNRSIYRMIHRDPVHQFFDLQKDMVPVHRAALPVAIGFSLVNFLISSPVLALITLINPEAGKNTPAGALIMIVEFLFIGSSFVRIMGDFFDKHSFTLAAKYKDICRATN